jgi:hypothetical protein
VHLSYKIIATILWSMKHFIEWCDHLNKCITVDAPCEAVGVTVIATNAMLCMSGIWCLLVVAVLVSAPQKETKVSIR